MSSHAAPTLEGSLYVKAGVLGAACGLTLLALAYGVVRAVLDRLGSGSPIVR